MKKFKYFLMALPLIALTACSAEDGEDPGTDSEPAVTMFSYTPSASSDLNADNDVILRFSTNSATKEVYYLVEPAADVEAFMAAHENDGDVAYSQRVIDNGTKFTVNGAESVDVNVTGLYGDYSIAAVASNGTSHSIYKATSFQGLDWSTLASGQFVFNQAFISTQAVNAELQICKTDANLYRIKDAFGAGYSVKFTGTGKGGVDDEGMKYQFVRVPKTATPVDVNVSGTRYNVWVNDIATWQGDASFATEPGYACMMWEDGYCLFYFAWMVTPGCIAYENPSAFVPDN